MNTETIDKILNSEQDISLIDAQGYYNEMLSSVNKPENDINLFSHYLDGITSFEDLKSTKMNYLNYSIYIIINNTDLIFKGMISAFCQKLEEGDPKVNKMKDMSSYFLILLYLEIKKFTDKGHSFDAVAFSKHFAPWFSVFTISLFKAFSILLEDFPSSKHIMTEITNLIDGLKHGIQSSVLKINTYRQVLIFEAVTGKIDVRDYQFERSELFA